MKVGAGPVYKYSCVGVGPNGIGVLSVNGVIVGIGELDG